MKRLLMSATPLMIALALATPAFAGHGGFYRGHGVIVHHPVYVQPIRPHFSFSLGFGIPGLFYGSAYRPSPVYYGPPPMMYGPAYGPRAIWVPGHYVLDDGFRVYREGHWMGNRHHDDDYDDRY